MKEAGGTHAKQRNADVLTFPGEVNEAGELQFFPWEDPQKQAAARASAKERCASRRPRWNKPRLCTTSGGQG